ncbi:MAG: hypothetical protein ACRYGL_03400 [Janthinobacterium lividum]
MKTLSSHHEIAVLLPFNASGQVSAHAPDAITLPQERLVRMDALRGEEPRFAATPEGVETPRRLGPA